MMRVHGTNMTLPIGAPGLRSPSAAGLLEAVAACAASLAWLIPNHYPPWASFYNEAAMLLALAAFTASVVAGRRTASVSIVAWVLAGVACIPVLQWLGGRLAYSGDALISMAYLLAAATAVQVGYSGYEHGRSRIAVPLSFAAMFGAVVNACIAIAQSFELVSFGIWSDYATPEMRAVGNLAQPNNLATLLGIGALSAVYLYERSRLNRIAALAIVVLLVTACALTQSRMSLCFGPIFVIGLALLRRRTKVRTSLAVAVAVTLLHWALMFAMPAVLTAVLGEAPPTLADRRLETLRFQMWRELLAAVQLRPWLGYGWLQVGAAELAVVDRFPPIGELWLHGHNIFLELLVWCGWPLGLLLGAALVSWFVSRTRRAGSVDAAWGLLVVAFVGVHALVELPQHYLYFLIPIALWVGIVEREGAERAVGSGWWFVAPAAAMTSVFIAVAVAYPALEDDFRLVRFEFLKIGDLRGSPPPPDPALSSLTAFLRFARTAPASGMSAQQLQEMDDAVRRYPYAASLVRYASMLALNGREAEAREAFVKIRYIYGDRLYERIRIDFHDQVLSGKSGLAALDRALPEASALRP